MKFSLLVSCLALSAFALSAKTPKASASCGTTPSPYRASLRHIEGKGIGYSKGYTTLDLFVTAPWTLTHKWIPFLDGRVHIFDNGRIATNIGLGCRYVTPSVVYGINSYYDYRETNRQKYNQYSLGFEALGKVWDVRLNGYLPVGQKRSAFYNTHFGYFSGYNIFLKGRRDLAMRGLDLEAGIHIKETSWMRLYGACGPYYFGKGGNNAAGGKVRLALSFFDQIKMEGSTSYDPIFHWIGQGELSWMIPFGPKKKKANAACTRSPRLYERSVQSVHRQEIIVLSDKTYYPVARDPGTTNPYRVLFVDNTSHSQGTFESPYSDLLTAQNNSAPGDLIYVFPGNGSDQGMDQGFVMQPNQKLWGSGIDNFLSTQHGIALIPAQTLTLPLLTNTTGSIVLMHDNCEVAGLNCSTLNAVGYGIQGGSLNFIVNGFVANPSLRSNTVYTPNATVAAIGLSFTGSATLTDCDAIGCSPILAAISLNTSLSSDDAITNAVLRNCTGRKGAGLGEGISLSAARNLTAQLSNCTGTGGGEGGMGSLFQPLATSPHSSLTA